MGNDTGYDHVHDRRWILTDGFHRNFEGSCNTQQMVFGISSRSIANNENPV